MITPYFEKESFWLPKGFVLPSKRSPFTMQKGSFYNAKGLLLFLANNRRGWQIIGGVCQKSKKARRRLSVGGYSIPAIPAQSTVNEG